MESDPLLRRAVTCSRTRYGNAESIARYAMEIAIDTSALSNILGADDGLARIAARLSPTDRVIIPISVVEELFAMENTERLAELAHRLGAFAHGHPRVIQFSVDGRTLVDDYEWRLKFHGGGFKTPRLRTYEATGLIGYMRQTNFSAAHKPVASRLRLSSKKDSALDLDREVRRDFLQRLPTATSQLLQELLSGFSKRLLSSDFHFLQVATKSKRHRRRVIASPYRYKGALVYASYLYLIALGSAFADVGYPRNPDILRAPRRGEWVDGMIATAAAHSDLLVSDDKGQRAKINFIAQQFGWSLKAITLGELLSASWQPANSE